MAAPTTLTKRLPTFKSKKSIRKKHQENKKTKIAAIKSIKDKMIV